MLKWDTVTLHLLVSFAYCDELLVSTLACFMVDLFSWLFRPRRSTGEGVEREWSGAATPWQRQGDYDSDCFGSTR